MSHVEKYKVASAYTDMHHIDSDENSKIKSIYERNIWKLKSKFIEYRNYLQAVNKKDEIAWLNSIQYLAYKTDSLPIPENTIYLDELSKGTYTSLNVDERNAGKYNKPETDAKYIRKLKLSYNIRIKCQFN